MKLKTETKFAIFNKKQGKFLKLYPNFSTFGGSDIKASWFDEVVDASLYRSKTHLFDDLEFVFNYINLSDVLDDLELVEVEISYTVKETTPLKESGF
jgi:hypothetical protein